MKKGIIILFCCFFFTGCYDYKELNNNYVVLGIGINKIEKGYQVLYEMVDSKEKESDKPVISSETGETLESAFQRLNQSLRKEPTLSHVKVVFFGEELATWKMKETIVYLFQNHRIHNTFYPTLIQGSFDEFFEQNSTYCSTSIQEQLDFNEQSSSLATKQTFTSFFNTILDTGIDAVINVAQKKQGTCSLTGLAAFSSDQLSFYFSEQESNLYQSFQSLSNSFLKSVLNQKPILSYHDSTIDIALELKDDKDSESLTKAYQLFLEKLQEQDSDVLGIRKKIYDQTRIDMGPFQEKSVHVSLDLERSSS